MTKTIYVCDCCGMEVIKSCLHECYKEIRDWRGHKNIPNTWELCENCIERLEAAMQREVENIAKLNIAKLKNEPLDDMYAGGYGIEV